MQGILLYCQQCSPDCPVQVQRFNETVGRLKASCIYCAPKGVTGRHQQVCKAWRFICRICQISELVMKLITTYIQQYSVQKNIYTAIGKPDRRATTLVVRPVTEQQLRPSRQRMFAGPIEYDITTATTDSGYSRSVLETTTHWG